MPRKETIGNRLTIARMEKGKALKPPQVPDLKEIGDDLGVSGAAVGQWEADKVQNWTLSRLRQLAKYYKVRLAWLIDGELPMRPPPADEVVDPAGLPEIDAPTNPKGTQPASPRRRAGGQ